MKTKKIPANTQHEYFVTRAELPVCCPTKDMILWNAHPRVYFPLNKEPEATCPYCGTRFVLTADKSV